MSASRKIVNLIEPANPPSKKAPLVWAIGAAIPWLVLAAGQVVWFGLDRRLGWLHAVAAAVTVLGFVVFVAVVPVWRYRVHRWDIGPKAVYTRTGWLVQERRIAPISPRCGGGTCPVATPARRTVPIPPTTCSALWRRRSAQKRGPYPAAASPCCAGPECRSW